MFYRYEALDKETGRYEGIFSFFNPSQRRYFNRFLKEPKWYEKNPDADSRCWFTEEGYTKYHSVMEYLISGMDGSYREIENVRILARGTLDNIVCKGKIQCIELLLEGEVNNESNVSAVWPCV